MVRIEKEKTLDDIQNNFHSIYHAKIKPLMEEFEKKRKIELLKFILVLVVAAVMIYIFINICFSAYSDGIMLITISVPFFAAFFMYNIANDFSKNLKRKCLPKIVKVFDNMKWVSGRQMLSTEDIFKSELFSEFNRREDDDAFVGEFKDVDFTISETALLYDSGGSKGRFIYYVFKGVIITFSSNKKIKNKTIIATKNDIHIKGRNWGLLIATLALLPGLFPIFNGGYSLDDAWFVGSLLFFSLICSLVLFFSRPKGKEKLNEIKLEDMEFNKRYRAFSLDEVEGRYLITTSFIERFKNLQTVFGAKNAKCSFYDNDIMFAISTRKNLFEIGNLFTPLTNPKHLTKFFNELSSILALIDYFKLDEKTGL